ncbi:DinB family protein [Gordonia westfalica]|uniref:DinB family protein n=1 Tax=Gordonia westfalica TaxID=158898 RepID=A0ABU2GVL6_9ACTN|nr:DinB family protein [Gordonia westfalica]MDS1115471.1 DinB family protein [Gordonia westfalica]
MAPRRKDTPPPSTGGSEKEVLVGFLDYLRSSAVSKLDGVGEADVRAAAVPSGTSLLGLVRHLTFVERFFFLGEDTANWKSTFTCGESETVLGIQAGYRQAVAEANAVIRTYADLGEPAPRAAGRRSSPSMRWALTHLIEETARHAGHLDIIRENIDGRTGR